MTNEFIKESTTGENVNIEIHVITQGTIAQAALWTIYESVLFECWLSPPPPKSTPNTVYLPRLTKTLDPFRDELGSALNKIHNTKTVK